MIDTLRLGVVAGESSGDQLGAKLVAGLRERCNKVELVGVGGEHLQACGLSSRFPMERLSVMGLVEPLQRLPELLRLRRELGAFLLEEKIDAFVGIDAPDFNLSLARRLRRAGCKTVQLVSPSIWAWRPGRVATIGRSVDSVLCLFPFEAPIYHAAGVAAQYVGHPLADELGPPRNQSALRERFAIPAEARVLTVLPGSRVGEIKQMAPVFLQAAKRLHQQGLIGNVLLPVANPACRVALEPILAGVDALPLTVIEAQSRESIAAGDVVLCASGTATLETALLQRPMVVAYRTGLLTWAVLSRMVNTEFVALPNILAGRQIVPEYLQQAATADNLAAALTPLLSSVEAVGQVTAQYVWVADSLRQNFQRSAADALLALASEQDL